MEAEDRTRVAWEPVSPGGVAAFADATVRRVWLVQLLIAVVLAGILVWVLYSAWFPVIHEAIWQLPSHGSVRSGRLSWEGETPARLAENHFLALTVDPRHQGGARSPAHLQVEFGERDVVFLSIFGAMQMPYPRGYMIAFNRDELEPWWGAWAPAILALTALAAIAVLMVTWGVLALLYCPIGWLIGFFANRRLDIRGSYRSCGAALMPGALFMGVVLVLYRLGALDVVRLLVMWATHLLIGWVYVIMMPFWRPRITGAATPKANPFTAETKTR